VNAGHAPLKLGRKSTLASAPTIHTPNEKARESGLQIEAAGAEVGWMPVRCSGFRPRIA
jgi:hypothetical protein